MDLNQDPWTVHWVCILKSCLIGAVNSVNIATASVVCFVRVNYCVLIALFFLELNRANINILSKQKKFHFSCVSKSLFCIYCLSVGGHRVMSLLEHVHTSCQKLMMGDLMRAERRENCGKTTFSHSSSSLPAVVCVCVFSEFVLHQKFSLKTLAISKYPVQSRIKRSLCISRNKFMGRNISVHTGKQILITVRIDTKSTFVFFKKWKSKNECCIG